METLTPNNPEKWFRWFILGICIWMLLILCSCDCQWHLKQAKKKCNQSFLSDTVYTHDTTYIKSVQKDTTFFYRQKDTTIIREGRLTIKYFYNTKDSTVYLTGKCDTVFVVKQIPTVINTTELKPDLFNKYKWWIIGLFFLLLVILLIKK